MATELTTCKLIKGSSNTSRYLMPANTGIYLKSVTWIPAFAGMAEFLEVT